MKPDPVLVNDLKAILEPLVAAAGQPDRRLVTKQARQTRRLRRDGWLAALDRAVGRSVRRKRTAAELLAELAELPEVADRFESWLRDADLGWRAEVIELVGELGLARFAPLLNDALKGTPTTSARRMPSPRRASCGRKPPYRPCWGWPATPPSTRCSVGYCRP